MGSIKGFKKVKIGLAISDDLKASADALNSVNSEMIKAMSAYDSAYKSVMSSASKGEQVRNAQSKVTSLAESKAKELGVAPSSVTGYADALKAWGVVDATIDKIGEL